MVRKSYPLEFKQEAVRLVQEESMTYAQVAARQVCCLEAPQS